MDYKTKGSVSAGKLDQLRYNEMGKADKQIPVLAMPFKVIADASLAVQQVGKGNLLRVKGVAGAFIQFSDDKADLSTAPGAATATALETPADFFLVVASGEFVRTSDVLRIEVIED